MGRLVRGMALMFGVAALSFTAAAPFFAQGLGAPQTAFEALRRHEAALRVGAPASSLAPGRDVLALAAEDARWSEADMHRFALDLAAIEVRVGQKQAAAERAYAAAGQLVFDPAATPAEIVTAARDGAAVALAAEDDLSAICIYGLALERLGPGRIAQPLALASPHPDFLWLNKHLTELAVRFARPVLAAQARADMPWTSCQLVAGIYQATEQTRAAAAVSRRINAGLAKDETVPPLIAASLHRYASEIEEADGNIEAALAEIEAAVRLLATAGHKEALSLARSEHGALLARYGESEKARVLLERLIDEGARTHGEASPTLIAPLIDHGLAALDLEDTAAAEASLRRAFAIASEANGHLDLKGDALFALTSLLEETGRTDEAAELRRRILDGDASLAPQSAPMPDDRIGTALRLVLPVTVTAKPWATRASDAFTVPAPGIVRAAVEVLVPMNGEAVWRDLWPADRLIAVSRPGTAPIAYAPTTDGAAPAARSDIRVLMIAGQGRDFAALVGEAARLQAAMGPRASLQLHVAEAGADARALRPSAKDDRIAARELAHELTRIAGEDGPPLSIVADGRGVRLLARAMSEMSDANAARLRPRIARAALIAPDLEAEAMATLLVNLQGAEIDLVSVRNVRALKASEEWARAPSLGLRGRGLAAASGLPAKEIVSGDAGAIAASPFDETLIARLALANRPAGADEVDQASR